MPVRAVFADSKLKVRGRAIRSSRSSANDRVSVSHCFVPGIANLVTLGAALSDGTRFLLRDKLRWAARCRSRAS